MEFLAPLMLAGAAGIAIPIAIHLIGRRRAKRVRFAALDFLLGSNKKTARRLQLREIILLITRVLVCLAIPLALAKPYTSCTREGPAVARGPQAAVLVLDDSYAAALRSDGESILDRARTKARAILDQLGPEADVAVVTTAEGADSPTELSRDHIRLRDAIGDVRATNRPADTTTALRRAAQLLAASNHERKTIYLLSPLAAYGFREGDPPWAPGTGPELTVVDVRGDGADDNLAVVGVEVEPDPDSGSRGVRVTAEIVNFSEQPADERGISLRIGERVVARGLVSLRPGDRTKKGFTASLPAGARAADVVVELDGDALAVDNRRYVRAQLREEVRALLVDGDPHTVRHDDEMYYLEKALRPGDRGDSGTSLTKATVDELGDLDLGEYDVIALANVRALGAERVRALESWVRAGGGLFVAPGDNVDPDAYNATMQPLLPQRLRTAIDTSFGARGSEVEGRALRLTKWEADHPIFSVFSRDAPGLRAATFTKVMLLGPTTRVDERKVLARYTNGATALVEARSDRGRLLLFTSTVDRDWNDLPIHPGFLPLMQQAVRYLARKQGRTSESQVVVGQSAVLDVRADDARLEIRSPGGHSTVLEGDELDGRKTVRVSETGEPGFYRITATGDNDDEHRRFESDFAVNLDPRGSDLRPLPPEKLPVSGGDSGTIGPATHESRVELWHALAVGLLVLLLLESALVLRP